jgi:cytochrome b561
MRIANSRQDYGAIAIALHWLLAVLLCALMALGWTMVALPDAGFDTRKVMLILYHKEIGLAAFAVGVVRLAWRLANPLPALPAGTGYAQEAAARFVHLAFYGLMLALPVSGWLMSSAAAIPVSWFGWFDLPDAVAPNEALFRRLIDVHRWLGWALAALLCLHAGAALVHHFLLRDDTLRKMLAPPDEPPAARERP